MLGKFGKAKKGKGKPTRATEGLGKFGKAREGRGRPAEARNGSERPTKAGKCQGKLGKAREGHGKLRKARKGWGRPGKARKSQGGWVSEAFGSFRNQVSDAAGSVRKFLKFGISRIGSGKARRSLGRPGNF